MKTRIAAVRIALGYTENQTEFADKLGVSQSTISSWELGDTKPTKTRLRLFERLGVNVDWLLTGNGEMFARRPANADDVAEIVAIYRKLTPEQRVLLTGVAQNFLKK